MTNARFHSAREVQETFPAIAEDMATKVSDATPLDFLAGLVAGETPEDAISFCAYLLDRRQCVWWACCCARMMQSPASRDEELALLAAEAWVRDPSPAHRKAALDTGVGGNHNLPGIWAALAAGGAGGNMEVNGQPGPPVPPHMCAKAARTAVLIALARNPSRERAAMIGKCADLARKILAEA